MQSLRADVSGTVALVNNAGIYLGKDLRAYKRSEIDHVVAANLVSALLCTAAFARFCEGSTLPGVIVNMSSVAGREGSSDAVYGATKAALIGLTRSCALTLSPRIRINCVAPGLVSTRMLADVPPERIDAYRARERITEPIDADAVAETVSFLLSPEARHYTGAVFDLNNGCYLG
jgi:3-oxoacyl-[acyl-carrier protein] reductase